MFSVIPWGVRVPQTSDFGLSHHGHGVTAGVWGDAVEEREVCGRTVFHERKKALQDNGLVHNTGSANRARWALTASGTVFLADATGS